MWPALLKAISTETYKKPMDNPMDAWEQIIHTFHTFGGKQNVHVWVVSEDPAKYAAIAAEFRSQSIQSGRYTVIEGAAAVADGGDEAMETAPAGAAAKLAAFAAAADGGANPMEDARHAAAQAAAFARKEAAEAKAAEAKAAAAAAAKAARPPSGDRIGTLNGMDAIAMAAREDLQALPPTGMFPARR
jgi:hypothetical protein